MIKNSCERRNIASKWNDMAPNAGACEFHFQLYRNAFTLRAPSMQTAHAFRFAHCACMIHKSRSHFFRLNSNVLCEIYRWNISKSGARTHFNRRSKIPLAAAFINRQTKRVALCQHFVVADSIKPLEFYFDSLRSFHFSVAQILFWHCVLHQLVRVYYGRQKFNYNIRGFFACFVHRHYERV